MIAKEFSLGNDFPRIDYLTWRKAVEADLKGAPFEKKMVSRTYEGIDLQPIYTEEIFPTSGDPFGAPGFPPFVRGSQVLGNSLAGWNIRQEHAAPDPAEANAQILDDLRNNVSSIVLRLDAASSAGYDADDQNAADLSGRDGVIISAAADLQRALDQVHLDIAGVWLDAGGAFLPAAALYVTSARLVGVEPDRLKGAFNADPLGALMREGSLAVPLDVDLKQMADLAAWTAANAPLMTAVEVSTSPYHHAGATSAQDLAFLLGTGVEYLRALTAGGLDVNAAAKQITFSASVGCRFYQAIAKIRAARMLWAQVVAACGGDAAAQTMRLRTTTSRRVLTTRSPAINILRNTAACYAGAIAGADAVTTVPFDAPVVLSTESSRRNARNTQLILGEECHLNHVIDPAGGSWYIEWYTRQLAEKAWALFQQIEAQGGMLAAASSGWVAQQIDVGELERERDIATRKLPITGISEHPDASEKKLGQAAPNRVELRMAAAQRLANWRATRAAAGPRPAGRRGPPVGCPGRRADGARHRRGRRRRDPRPASRRSPPAGLRAGSRRRSCHAPLRRGFRGAARRQRRLRRATRPQTARLPRRCRLDRRASRPQDLRHELFRGRGLRGPGPRGEIRRRLIGRRVCAKRREDRSRLLDRQAVRDLRCAIGTETEEGRSAHRHPRRQRRRQRGDLPGGWGGPLHLCQMRCTRYLIVSSPG